ncbi:MULTISPECIES: hypothetical protein [Sphingomonas]|jgi:hypothetical protein|uniref:Uncharacterized protein n=1 Tax=Sphingomonas leidyi TaxID=68569 RepID=A0A7X5UVZ8_9SPHN|nr:MULTISPECIES: hypothetical protein [Sphingomonas]MBN8812071.1 hypothetical protein [Sphingomonas sp.]NIJ63277.1 hypothetical protein [Sphingomonas leidyi]OJY48289.1 MAG: hypothetical protein BGP17_00430 [Sphingomonas sp. 67-41]
MTRLFLGGALGGLAMWLVGFIFWGTPLSLLALSQTDAATTAAVQAALAQHLGPLGSGAYPIPWAGTPQGTQLYGQGPTALVMFNTGGFAMPDSGALIGGLVLAIVCALLAGFALRTVAHGHDFARRLRLVAIVALAVTAYSDLGQPIFNHAPWGYFLYLWVSDVASWIAAGAVLAWALPRPAGASGA